MSSKSPFSQISVIKPASRLSGPHDALFKSMCGDIKVAIDLLKVGLPPELFQKIQLESLNLTDKSFVSADLRQYHSDIIYEAKIQGHEGYIAFLIEHQSSPDALMAFRKLEYNVGLMRQHLKQGHLKLPVIINLCLYHGAQSPYPHSNDLFECFSDPVLARTWMFSPFQLIDLTVLSNEEIETHGYAALLDFLLKHAGDAALSREAKQLAQYLRRLDIRFHLEPVLYYLLDACGNQDNVESFLQSLIQELPEVGESIMTYGQQLIQKGMQQGMQQGSEQEKLSIARNLLINGADDDLIRKSTGLKSEIIIQLKKQLPLS